MQKKSIRLVAAALTLLALAPPLSQERAHSQKLYTAGFAQDTMSNDWCTVQVNDVKRDLDDAAIVQAIISVAKNLQLNVVAEGVETQEQLAFLQANDCENVQGYLFSRPLPAGEFMQYIKNNLV